MADVVPLIVFLPLSAGKPLDGLLMPTMAIRHGHVPAVTLI
jgi:hypothetical protein